MSIKIAIVEDIPEIRNGLSMLIGGSPGFECIGVFESGEEAILGIPNLMPDVVLCDIHMGGISGIEVVQILKKIIPDILIVMSTVYDDEENIFKSLEAGAVGYLLKNATPIKLLDALREVYEGGSPMSASVARKVISKMQVKKELPNEFQLTSKEKEILKALSEGLRYKEIANNQFISIDTVRTHVRHIYEKLQVQSRTEALNKAFGKS